MQNKQPIPVNRLISRGEDMVAGALAQHGFLSAAHATVNACRTDVGTKKSEREKRGSQSCANGCAAWSRSWGN